MTDSTWQILEERVLVNRPPWLLLAEQDVQLPDGRIIEGYLKAHAPPYAVIFAMDSANQVVTIEEYKHGPGRVVVHLPAGYMELGEDPMLAAQRELLEETGYEAPNWTLLGVFCQDGNREMGWGHCFLATGARQVAAANHNDLSDIRTVLLTPAELKKAIYGGRVAVADIVACIMLGLDAVNNGLPADDDMLYEVEV